MTGRVVIGANFGDEGKGLFVDYLASQGGDVVVRFNGGCQAGHTVVTPDNRRHVFSHFGSGSLLGLPTFFSQHTIINPVLFIKEYAELQKYVSWPVVFVHPDARVTTPWDMNSNQDIEEKRDKQRHGSCGVGIFETIQRDRQYPLRMRDLWDNSFEMTFNDILNHYGDPENGESLAMRDRFERDIEWFSSAVRPGEIKQFSDPIFEGAQGLLLCQSNMDMYPHLTPSYCGMHNVRELAHEARLHIDSTYYISRPYLTRHGAGPLEREYNGKRYADNTNNINPWQGKLRFAPMDFDALLRRVHADTENPRLVFTHCDQESVPFGIGAYHSFGPTREDVCDAKQKQPERGSIMR